jgi:segregation and condensation protein B
MDGLRRESLEEIDTERELESRRKVEAALFVAGKFLSMSELVALTDVNPLMLRKILDDLGDKYRNSGIEIVRKNESWKMDVAGDYIWIVNKLATGNAEFSKAEQETLAIIAYKQPMKQSVLVKIRGNKAYEHIAKFVETGLVNKKKQGHTAELTLTEDFHEYFSLPMGAHSLDSVATSEESDAPLRESVTGQMGEGERVGSTGAMVVSEVNEQNTVGEDEHGPEPG